MIVSKAENGFVPQNHLKLKSPVWLNARQEPFKIYGLFYDKGEGRFLRMNKKVADDFDSVFIALNSATSGGRLRFCTDSPYVALFVRQKNNVQLNNMTLCGHSGFDIYAEQDYIGTFLPKTNARTGFCATVETDGKYHEYTINFPLYDNVEELFVALAENSVLEGAAPYINEGEPIVFYGSSITQGACASRPGNCYTSLVCRKLNRDYLNLGFASRCRGEQKMAEYIAGLKMSAFVLDYDHNTPSAEELAERHFAFYETVRKAHPDIPIIIMSAPDIAVGKAGFKERREIVKATYSKAASRGENVYFVDGKKLFGTTPKDCTVDNVHPNDFGFINMQNELLKVFKEVYK